MSRCRACRGWPSRRHLICAGAIGQLRAASVVPGKAATPFPLTWNVWTATIDWPAGYRRNQLCCRSRRPAPLPILQLEPAAGTGRRNQAGRVSVPPPIRASNFISSPSNTAAHPTMRRFSRLSASWLSGWMRSRPSRSRVSGSRRCREFFGHDDVSLWLGCIATSFWQAYHDRTTAPSRKTNYEPVAILVFSHGLRAGGFLRTFHQSNGRTDNNPDIGY